MHASRELLHDSLPYDIKFCQNTDLQNLFQKKIPKHSISKNVTSIEPSTRKSIFHG